MNDREIKQLETRIKKLEQQLAEVPLTMAGGGIGGGGMKFYRVIAQECVTMGQATPCKFVGNDKEVDVWSMDGEAPAETEFVAMKFGTKWYGFGVGNYIYFGETQGQVTPGATVTVDIEALDMEVEAEDFLGFTGEGECLVFFQQCQWWILEVACGGGGGGS